MAIAVSARDAFRLARRVPKVISQCCIRICGFRIAALSLPLFLACTTMRGTAAVDGSGAPLLDANGLPVNQVGKERAQPGFASGDAPITDGTGALFAEGLLARARAEWV